MIIELEGVDGVGKSTQARMVKALLEDDGYRVKIIHYPIRNSKHVEDINAGASREVQWMLNRKLARERKYTVGGIIDANIRYDFVILDRYKWSGMAYGLANDFDKEWLLSLDKHSIDPDLVIFLKDGTVELDPYLEKVEAEFKALAKEYEWPVVDIMSNVEDTAEVLCCKITSEYAARVSKCG